MNHSTASAFGAARWVAEYIRKRGWAHSPVFRKRFTVSQFKEASCVIAGLGLFELRLNGRKVGEDMLTPAFTRYDLRTEYFRYDVAPYLQNGENVAEVMLGNGFYNQITPDVFRSEHQSWKNDPRFLLNLTIDGQSVLVSDETWLVAHGPIISNSVRTGETYDAGRELAPWRSGETPDPDVWRQVCLSDSPGGELNLAEGPACRIVKELETVAQWHCGNGTILYDFGENITGNCEIAVSGPAGSEVKLVHGEKLNNRNELDNGHIGMYTFSPDFQTDRFILGPAGEQVWSPRFSWHGFRYVQITLPYEVTLKRITARVIRSNFAEIGHAECSDQMLNKLTCCALRSYESNFVNHPTDCPHREKMGWTGDAQLAAELGLWHYDAKESYRAWLHSMRDCQRRSGQIPGMVPYCDHWQFGPVWDGALILLPYQIWRFTGDESIVRENYEAAEKLVGYWRTLARGDLIDFGPGDWCHVDRARAISGKIDASAFYCHCLEAMAAMAVPAGRPAEQGQWLAAADAVRKAFQQEFCRPGGHCAKDEPTALALALAFDLAPAAERRATAERLNQVMLEYKCRAEFGIVGAKFVPRALAANGFFDTALKILTQEEFPGWGNWIRLGATSLWESWTGAQSRNHVMFGDLGAWLWEYAGGLEPLTEAPGFRKFRVTPPATAQLSSFAGTRRTAGGELRWEWHAEANGFTGELTVPQGCTAIFQAPGRSEVINLDAGTHRLNW